MPERNTPIEEFRDVAVVASDGTRLFQFFRAEKLAEYSLFLKSLLPHWWNDETQLIGNATCGDTLVNRNGNLYLIDHDTMEINKLRMTEAEFYALVRAKDPLLDKMLYAR